MKYIFGLMFYNFDFFYQRDNFVPSYFVIIHVGHYRISRGLMLDRTHKIAFGDQTNGILFMQVPTKFLIAYPRFHLVDKKCTQVLFF